MEIEAVAGANEHGFGWNGHVFVEKATSEEKFVLFIEINFSKHQGATILVPQNSERPKILK